MATKARGTKGRRRKTSRASSGGMWPLLAVLALVIGGISAYDNRSQLLKVAHGLIGDERKGASHVADGALSAAQATGEKTGSLPPLPIPAPVRRNDPLPPAATPVAGVAALQPLRSDAPLPPASGNDVDQQVASLRGGMAEKQRMSGKFYYCGTSGLNNCVVDGDTFWVNRMKIRMADIDAPETEQAKCKSERDRGFAAKMRLRDLLNAGSFELSSFGTRDEDKYGRKLRVVTRDGRSLGAMLVDEGLARPWTGQRKPWC
ncbi:thermonuclease family protein [Allorhizobium undicola]|uniref:thermonuclease family protein n=1 Tax=Allorhizobium undicola TaxID=78527 RepID=UPI000567E44A|nr:thermonuclease family protein [Allorhizobium undicola]